MHRFSESVWRDEAGESLKSSQGPRDRRMTSERIGESIPCGGSRFCEGGVRRLFSRG